ncbi:MAG: monosaccharide-transporting ATPase [Bellilinea sp.]|nr:MAG: monosaccharide-transporting ATPase [Bellilinea sp.]
MSDVIVLMNKITKAFNNITVLNNVDFELQEGEIHALLGENGAGKSTLMKILRGVYQPDSGQIIIQGKSYDKFNTPNEARAAGIGMVFQEFSLIPTLTVAQNIFLTREIKNKAGLIDDKECEKRAKAFFDELEVEIDPRMVVSALSTGYRQLTEITAALSQEARILIFDEPTASLTQTETLSLFRLMRRLKEKGISMIYISHRMEEIFKIADRVTVLRDGRKIITEKISNLTIADVIEHILGRKAEAIDSRAVTSSVRKDKVLLEVDNLKCIRGVHNVSFKLYSGEVLGIAGLMGSGRTELVQAIFGINPLKSGEIRVNGKQILPKSPEDSMKSGIALIPEDRRVQGLILNHNIKENFILPMVQLNRLSKGKLFVDYRRGASLAELFVKNLRIRTDSIDKIVKFLSGGNQQKVVIAKWLSTDPEILLMDEPTAGVDIGTKGEIIDMIRELAKQGKGIIFISSELQELLAVCDRVIVIKNGFIDRELDRREISGEERLHQILQGAGING